MPKQCKSGFRWCDKTNKCVADTPGKQQGKGDGVGQGKGPIGKSGMRQSGMDALKRTRGSH